MGWIAKDLPTLIFMLIPGFFTAGIYYALTAHPKTSEFERIIQALIFTSIIRFFILLIRASLLFIGRAGSIGYWTSDTEFMASILIAIIAGLGFSIAANTDKVHGLLRKRNIINRTSYPSEWYGAFVHNKRWIVLHLNDGRRLYGWPEQWPDQADRGHFVIDQPAWLLIDNQRAPLYRVRRFLLPAAEVKMVEFVMDDEDVVESRDDIERIDRLLIEAQTEDSDHGSESASTGAEQAAETSERSGWNQGLQRPGADSVQTGASASATPAPTSEIAQEVNPEVETGRVDDQLKAKD